MNEEIDCPVCDGYGYSIKAECCGRTHCECGSRRCEGPVPVQECCQECNGYGKILIQEEQ